MEIMIMFTCMQVIIKWREDEAKASHKTKVYDRVLLLPIKVQ